MKMTRGISQHEASLEHDARQPRLAMKADGPTDTKTRERPEGAATPVQATHGDTWTAQKVQDGPKTSASFGVKAETPDLPCREDVLVENSAASPQSCLPSSEMCSPIAAGGLLPTGEASTATRTTFNQPPLRFYSTEKRIQRRILGLGLYTSRMTAVSCLLPIPAGWPSRRNRDKIGRSILAIQGHLRACPFLASWRALLCEEAHVRGG